MKIPLLLENVTLLSEVKEKHLNVKVRGINVVLI